jgi:hypothetical protein
MLTGNKYRIIAVSYMGNKLVPTVSEGRYIETDSSGIHYFRTAFSSKVAYNPELGWKFIPLEDDYWLKSQC